MGVGERGEHIRQASVRERIGNLHVLANGLAADLERRERQIERAREYVEKHDGIGIYRSTLLSILSESETEEAKG